MRIVLVVLLVAIVGCRRFSPEEMKVRYVKFFVFEEKHAPKSLKRQLTPGITRAQAHAFYKHQPMSSHIRPAAGWTTTGSGTNGHIFRAADTYEWLHETNAHRCDVFQSPAGHSYLQLLPDIDYLFYDPSDKLIGFHHEMVGD